MNLPTPCFVLEEEKLIHNLELISKVQKEAGIEIILAFKGFAMWSAFPLLRKYIGGATASSWHEVKLCKEEMKVKSHTYCVAYDPNDFQNIVDNSSHLTFNSLTEYHRWSHLIPKTVSIGLRVNPEYSDVSTELYNPSHPQSRLGITSENLTSLPEKVEGLHFHVLCESNSYALEKALESLELKFGHLLAHLKWVNMGGGHLITNKGYDISHLTQLLIRFKKKYDVAIILEPGSAFAWQAGDLHTSVLDIVENGSKTTAIFDASFTCHMPDCLEMPYRPDLENGSKIPIKDGHAYQLGGISCLAGDFLDEYWFEHPLSVGDRLVFKDMMHYTMVKTTTFNGIKHPSIGILSKEGRFDLIKSFGYDDFKGRLS